PRRRGSSAPIRRPPSGTHAAVHARNLPFAAGPHFPWDPRRVPTPPRWSSGGGAAFAPRDILSLGPPAPYKRGVASEEQRVPLPVFEDETTDVISLTDAGRRRSGKRDRCALTLLTGVQAGLVHTIESDETVLWRGHGCQVRI